MFIELNLIFSLWAEVIITDAFIDEKLKVSNLLLTHWTYKEEEDFKFIFSSINKS